MSLKPISPTAVRMTATIVAFWIPIASSVAIYGQESDEAVKRTLESWADAIVKGELDKVIGFYVDDSKTLVIVSSGDHFQGTEEIREVYREGYEEVRFESISLTRWKIHVSGDVATVACNFMAHTIQRSNDAKWEINTQTTFTLVRRSGKWQIMLEHSSTLPNVPRLKGLDQNYGEPPK